jgi:hypothetical protein
MKKARLSIFMVSIYATLCYYIMSIYGRNGDGSDEDENDMCKYVDNAGNGLALQIDRKVFLLDGSSRPARDISMWEKKIIELGDPSDDKDAASKSYVDRRFRGVRTFIARSVQQLRAPFMMASLSGASE